MESSASFRRPLEGSQSAEIDTGNVANRDKHHHSGAAAMASDHCPGRAQIDLRLGDVELGVAARALAFRICHLDAEDVQERPRDRVAVEGRDRSIAIGFDWRAPHPVGPKRSVLMREGS